MRFSSFIAITAAGLAIAAPITPYTRDDKALTVEPNAVSRRQLNGATGPLSTVTSVTQGGLPVVGKRQLGLDSLLPSTEEEKEVEPKEPVDPTEDGAEADVAPAAEDSDVTGTGLLRRQLPDLNSLLSGDKAAETPAEDTTASDETADDDDDDEEDDEEKDEKEKKKSEKKKDDEEKDAKKKSDDEEKDEEKKSDKKKDDDEEKEDDAEEEEDSDEDSDEEKSTKDDKEAAPAETKGGFLGTGILARGLGDTITFATDNGVVDGLTKTKRAESTSTSTETTDAAEDAAAADKSDPLGGLGGLGGILRRQLGGLLGDKEATPDGDDDPNTQVSAADDGTNGENSFDAADDKAADETADEETAAEDEEKDADAREPAAKEPGLLGGLGL